MDRLRFGLIGVGKHGRRYAKHLREDFDDLELAAFARRDAGQIARTAAELGCRGYADYRELISAPDVDAVIVVVPPALHLEIVSAAARAGKPVILEKPAAARLAAGRALLGELRGHPVPLTVAHTLRYNAVVRSLLSLRERIGRIHAVTLTQRFEPSSLPWIDDPQRSGGGITLHTGVHSFDLLRVLTGLEAAEVRCSMTSLRTERTEDSFAAAVRMSDGLTLATVSGSRAAGGRTGYIELAGERGSLIGDHVAQWAHLVAGTAVEPIALGPPIPTVRELLREFATALRRGTRMPVTFEEGLRAVAIAEACYVSAQSGETARVETID